MNNIISKYLVYYPTCFFRGQHHLWSEIDNFKKMQYLDSESIKSIQWKRFKQIITFAYENIEFYKRRFDGSGLHPDDIGSFNDISNIPTLSKQEIVSNEDIIYNPNYAGIKHKRVTSGSSGAPLVFYKDSKSMEIMDAILYRNYSWFGIDVGDRQARFWGHSINNIQYLKTKLLDGIINRVRLSPFQLHEKTYIAYLKKIKQFQAQYIYGYAQSIFQFSKYFYAKEIDLSYLKLKAIILTGEMVFPEQMDIIKKVFGCSVTEEYGCTETGLIAFRCEYGNMHLMENLYVEESRNDADNNNSGELIISELYGNLFPLIRYEIGDRGTIKEEKCVCGRGSPVLTNIAGRKDDFIKCPDNKLIDPYCLEYIICNMPKKYGKIFQFQIIQESMLEILILFNAEGDFNKIDKFVTHEFIKILSCNITLTINFVSTIEKESSGKLRCFISKIN